MERRGLRLHNRQMRNLSQLALDRCLKQRPVCLNPRPLHGRAFRRVEHAIMDRSIICRTANEAIKCVDFAHQMPFSKTADGWIT